MRLFRYGLVLLIAAFILAPVRAAAQAPQRGKLTITVADQTGAVIPNVTVTLDALEAAAKAAPIPPAKTTDKGSVTFDDLIVGRYSARAEFPGFKMGLLRDFRVTRGDNKHVVVLALEGMTESVTVGAANQAADRASRAFGLTVTQEQIQALSDDPDEMARQLNDIAGPGAIVRIDSFEGQQLPPKSQIKSIHVTRDQFAAETEQPGSTFVDVITQPGVGPIRGSANGSFRDGSMSAKSQFTPTKGPEQIRGYGFNIGGAIIKQVSNFSIGVNGFNNYVTPNLNVATAAGKNFEVLNLRQPISSVNVNGLFDYALTRDQTLRFGYSQNNNSRDNQGVGSYDFAERAFKSTQNRYQFRALEAGPIGRRTFINTRMTMAWVDFGNKSAVEKPTIIVQDAFNSGGAQQSGRVHGKNLTFASDVDYVRGIHSWRGGVQVYADWYRANLSQNYLGTYVFTSPAAYEAGTPLLYTRSVGDPNLHFMHARTGAYFQDDIRVKKGLTLSPGVRYSYQTHVPDRAAYEPRVGMTWAPTKSGNTTLRASGGIFHGWLDPGIWWQTVRSDSNHQRDIIITNPSYPDPGPGGLTSPANTYVLGNYKLNKNLRYSTGIDQRFSPRASVNVLYTYYHQDQLPRGTNLNAPVGGVRANPAFGNIISTVTDAELIRHELFVNFNLSLMRPGPAAGNATFNWKRLAANGSYSYLRARRNAMGPFDVPATGTLATEWGHGPADNPYRINVGVTSTQLKNLSVNLSVNASDGFLYNETTGFDENHDGLLNDRPAGVGIWSLRTPPTWTVNTRLAYNLPIAQRAPPAVGPAAPQRYRASVFVSINNLTNHANLGGFSGVRTSPFFMTATSVQNPRKVDLGMNVSF
jgi:carboxypeptidase family protein